MIFSPDGRSRVRFIEVPEVFSPEVRAGARRVKRNRMHFDLRPDDQTAEVAGSKRSVLEGSTSVRAT